MPALFDILNSINNKTPLLTQEEIDRDYPAFMVNRGLSFFMDTVLYAAEMNRHADTPPYAQYLFYYHGTYKKRRFSKWHKKAAMDNIDIVKEYYHYSDTKAEEALAILTDDQIEEIKTRLYKGGKA